MTCRHGTAWLLGALALGSVSCGSGLTDGQEYLFLIGGFNVQADALSSAVYRSVDGKSWEHAGDLPSPRWFGSAVVYENRLWYLGGGSEDSSAEDTVWSTGDGKMWSAETSLPLSIADADAVSYKGTLWLFGGYDLTHFSNGSFSTTDGSWTTHSSSLPSDLYTMDQGVEVFEDRIWFVGGITDNDQTPGAETASGSVDTSTDGTGWTNVTTIGPRRGHGLVVFNDQLLAIGGRNGLTTFDEVVRVGGGSVGAIGTIPGPRVYPAVAAFKGNLYVAGGSTDLDPANATDTVFVSSDGISWTTGSTLPQRLQGARLVTFKP